ncbi:2-C-methyl-D-erythritol 4-phosphate cytidylyltransferase [Chloroflexota bacterium]
MASLAAIVPAAGRSERMGGRDKLLLSLGGKPLLAWCIDTLEACESVDRIVIAVSADKMSRYERLLSQRRWKKSCLCAGGARRQDSVAAALPQVSDADIVMVHDGDRPFVTPRMVEQGLEIASEVGAAVAAVPVKDTIKVVGDDCDVQRTLNRDKLRAIQTPQVFRRELLVEAYALMCADVTDDAALVEQLGYPVSLFHGAYENLKVTTLEDLVLARAIARSRKETQ